jgi:hypothetical protein
VGNFISAQEIWEKDTGGEMAGTLPNYGARERSRQVCPERPMYPERKNYFMLVELRFDLP